MEFCHRDIDLHSVAAQRLAEFMDKRRQKWARRPMRPVWTILRALNSFHSLTMAIERELVSEELGRYDVTAEEIEVGGKTYCRSIRLPETYLTSAGRVTIERNLYKPADPKDQSICPMEQRSGVIAGYFTPQAARQGAFVMAHLTPERVKQCLAKLAICSLREAVWID